MKNKVEFSKQRPYHPAGVEIELSESGADYPYSGADSYISVINYGQEGSRSTIIFAEDVPAVAAAMLGVDAQYLALCVALAKHTPVNFSLGIRPSVASGPWRLHSVGVTHSDVEHVPTGGIWHPHNSNIKILDK